MDQLLYPVNDAARLLGIGRSKLWELIGAGDVQTVRIGKRRLVPRAQIEALVTALVEGKDGVDPAPRLARSGTS